MASLVDGRTKSDKLLEWGYPARFRASARRLYESAIWRVACSAIFFTVESMRAKPDQKRLVKVMGTIRTRIVTDTPKDYMALTFEEAELLLSGDIGIVASVTSSSVDFWVSRPDGAAIRALRELRKTDSD